MTTDIAKERQRAAQWKRFEVQLKKPENRECFDCKSKQPRWASTNLGIYLCLRCAGIHRSLGVHITKVKSTNMDLWDEDMILRAERIGNGRGKELYEVGFNEPKPEADGDTAAVERLARRKYDQKLWFAPDWETKVAIFLSMPPDSSNGSPTAVAASPASNISSPAPAIVQAIPVTGPTSNQNVVRGVTVGYGSGQTHTQQNAAAAGSLYGGSAKEASHGVEWGGFVSGTPTSPAAANPSPASGTQAASTQKKDFWDEFDSGSSNRAVPKSPPSSSPASGGFPEFGAFQGSPVTTQPAASYRPIQQNNAVGGPAAKPAGDMISFQPSQSSPVASSGVNNGQGKQHVDDIMAAFGGRGPSPGSGFASPPGYPPPIPGAASQGLYGHMTLPPHHQQHLPHHHHQAQSGGFPW